MTKFQIWFYVIGAVSVALLGNYISAVWASKENKLTIWLLAVIIISPIVFITFGLVVSKLGLAISAATIDSLLAISTILVGLFIFHEWNSISFYQYVGITLTVIGIIFMRF